MFQTSVVGLLVLAVRPRLVRVAPVPATVMFAV
jgi:hypothetical protein